MIRPGQSHMYILCMLCLWTQSSIVAQEQRSLRILFSLAPSFSHQSALEKVAKQLAQRGHAVQVRDWACYRASSTASGQLISLAVTCLNSS